MKKTILVTLSCLLIISCNVLKKTETALNTGNYDTSINLSLKKLKGNKTKKKLQPYVLLLQEAYAKAQKRDLDRIGFLQKEVNPANSEEIFNTYKKLNFRQEQIKPYLPLKIYETGKNAVFNFSDYSTKIINAKSNLVDYLYNNANKLMATASSKNDYRKAYEDLVYLQKLRSNYKNVNQLIDEALYKGTNFVHVNVTNKTRQIIPRRLEADLLNFDTYGLNNKWTVYHGNKAPNVTYDFGMEIALRRINISPERINERQIIREKEIKDGWKYIYDRSGNIKKDSLGNKIKVDKFITVRCELYEFTQSKYVQIEGLVRYKNLLSNQQLDSFPITSEYAFENIYAEFNGDTRALENDLLLLTDQRPLPFPSNEQMVFDTGEDLKAKIKSIIKRQQL